MIKSYLLTGKSFINTFASPLLILAEYVLLLIVTTTSPVASEGKNASISTVSPTCLFSALNVILGSIRLSLIKKSMTWDAVK